MKSTENAAAVYVPVEHLKPWAKNPRKNDPAVSAVADSIKRFGFGAPLLARQSNGEVIAGHTRLKAAMKLGLTEVPVRYLDLDEHEAHALALADNRVGELAEWDDAALGEILRDLDAAGASIAGLGWGESELDELLHGATATDLGETVGDDEVPEVVDGPADSVPGGVYELGPHMLVCGSATDRAAWSALNIPRASSIVITSPPYGVGKMHHLRNHLEAGVKTPKTKFYSQHDDSADEWPGLMREWTQAAKQFSACVVVNVQMLADNKRAFVQWLSDNAESLIDIIVWDKGRGPPCAASGVLTTQWEFVVGLGDSGASRAWPLAAFQGDRANVIRVPPIHEDDGSGHGARFPVAFPERVLELVADKAEIVVDCFAGTGTTMLAAARHGRSCRMIELDPKFCDFIRRRWTRWARENGQDPGTGALDG